MGPLQAIRYRRGSLELLDQRLLPLKSVFLPIDGTQQAWAAIKDMVVRGAPAIGVTAALALAVELHHGGGGGQFGSASEAIAHVESCLDHLVTSRPTAVNLEDAAKKLKAVAGSAGAEERGTAESVVAAVVEAAEAMLAEDVKTNEAIGKHGSLALQAACSGRALGKDGQLRVLTHCNTGSLATSGFGTALGVVRALNNEGKLDHVYCTETRPYNQGARLTAYELMHDGLPCTLICDSAAAALMAQGKVDAVVVGADRVAANGDTANKIGTLSLAVAAAHYRIPFFVAAPSTSIDLKIAGGNEIKIEERSDREVTHVGDKRVVVEGMAVWNPAFDVTPAALIEGIITEAGTISRSKGVFEIRDFLCKTDAHMPQDLRPVPQPPGFYPLDTSSAREYITSRPDLLKLMGDDVPASEWTIRETGDGNINFVYIVEGPSGSLVLKQGLPFVRCVGESWPLTLDRVRLEAYSLKEMHRLCPEHVPEVYLYDAQMAVMAMRYLAPPHIILSKGIAQGKIYPDVATHIATFLAKVLFNTSLVAKSSEDFRAEMVKFNNPKMCELTEQVIFLEPYIDASNNRWTTPQLDADVQQLHADVEARRAILQLRRKFMAQPEALLHADLHCGSIMVTSDTTFVFDSEFAFYGPMGFDVGKIIANFLISFFACDGHATSEDPRTEQRRWLLKSCREVWEKYVAGFTQLWSAAAADRGGHPCALAGDRGSGRLAETQKEFIGHVWSDAVGFMGAVMIRRTIGIAHVQQMESISDPDTRSVCERRVLQFGRSLLVETDSFTDIAGLLARAEKAREDGRAL